jgi:hypothetical protein
MPALMEASWRKDASWPVEPLEVAEGRASEGEGAHADMPSER